LRLPAIAYKMMKPRIILSLILFASQTTLCGACQICIVAMSYNAFRFSPIWIVLFFAWLIVRFFLAGNEKSKKRAMKHVCVFPFAVLLIAIFTGLHFLIILAAPVFPFFAAVDLRSSKSCRYIHAIFFALLLISAPIAQSISPYVYSETEAGTGANKCKKQLRSISDSAKSYFLNGPQWPKASLLSEGEYDYSVLPRASLEDITQAGNLETIVDPFAVQEAYYPFSYILLSPGDNFYRPKTLGFAGPQYIVGEKGFVFWMRGPDGIFTKELTQEFNDAVNGKEHSIIEYSYDPTNGTISQGDLWELRHFESDQRAE